MPYGNGWLLQNHRAQTATGTTPYINSAPVNGIPASIGWSSDAVSTPSALSQWNARVDMPANMMPLGPTRSIRLVTESQSAPTDGAQFSYMTFRPGATYKVEGTIELWSTLDALPAAVTPTTPLVATTVAAFAVANSYFEESIQTVSLSGFSLGTVDPHTRVTLPVDALFVVPEAARAPNALWFTITLSGLPTSVTPESCGLAAAFSRLVLTQVAVEPRVDPGGWNFM